MRGISLIFLLPWCFDGACAETLIEIGTGLNSADSHLVLIGIAVPAAPLFNTTSYYQFDAGGWSGPRHSLTAGVARGLEWEFGDKVLRFSLGASLISDTSDRLSTAFEFYEQLMLRKDVGGFSVALSYRHWSNGRIKRPNVGMNFIGVQIAVEW